MESDPPRRGFQTTQWTLVLEAGDRQAPGAEAALARLCTVYWPPVYAFIRRSGHDADAARDYTQAFFARVLEKNYFGQARRERGRFRSFLLASVRHFLANERDAARALKRGGGQPILPLEYDDGERIYRIEPVDDLTPEKLFDRRWALGVIQQALARVRKTHDEAGKSESFTRMLPFITGAEPEPYAVLAAEQGVSEGAIRVAVHRLRRQFGAALREIIAETVERPEEVDEELRYLLAALRQ